MSEETSFTCNNINWPKVEQQKRQNKNPSQSDKSREERVPKALRWKENTEDKVHDEQLSHSFPFPQKSEQCQSILEAALSTTLQEGILPQGWTWEMPVWLLMSPNSSCWELVIPSTDSWSLMNSGKGNRLGSQNYSYRREDGVLDMILRWDNSFEEGGRGIPVVCSREVATGKQCPGKWCVPSWGFVQCPEAARMGRNKKGPDSKNVTIELQETVIQKMEWEDKISFHSVSEEMPFNPGSILWDWKAWD